MAALEACLEAHASGPGNDRRSAPAQSRTTLPRASHSGAAAARSEAARATAAETPGPAASLEVALHCRPWHNRGREPTRGRAETRGQRPPSVAVQKFPIACGQVGRELLNQSHTSKSMILVSL